MSRAYPVTAEHYRKYQALARRLRVKFNETTYRSFGFETFGELFAYQARDPPLENLPASVFAAWAQATRVFNKEAKPLATFELVCLAKHCLLDHTLGAKPRFTDKKEMRL
jgi:hypothetical protein